MDQWPLYTGEIYTIVPNPVDFEGEPVACANITFRSDDPAVASVTSWGEVEALRPGVANITVQSGGALQTVAFTIRNGERPVVTDDEWDQQHPSRCAVSTDEVEKVLSIDDGDDADAPDAARPGNETGSPNLRAMEYAAQSSLRAKTNFGSSNYSFVAPLLSLSGRELGVSLSLYYNGQPWQKDVVGGATKMTFNYGKGWPAAGWRLGFGRIIAGYDPAKPNNRLLIQPDGTKIVLRYDTSTSPAKCLSEDGTFLEYSPSTGKLKYPNGTIVNFNLHFNNRWLPVAIESPNGNIVTISYKPAGIHKKGSIDVITDTLGRTVTFHYYGDSTPVVDPPPPADTNNLKGSLYSIRVEDRGFIPGGMSNKRELVRLSYLNLPAFDTALLESMFDETEIDDFEVPSGFVTAVAGIYYPATGTGYAFDYASPYGMATTIHVRKDMTSTTTGVDVARTTYAFPTSGMNLSNLPRFSSRTEWRDDGNGGGITSTWNYAHNSGGTSAPSTYTVTAASASPDVIVTRTTVGYQGFSDGKTTTTEVFKTSVTGQLMRKVEASFDDAPDDAASIWTSSNGGQVVDTVITTNESGEQTKLDYDYTGGSFGQVMKIDEFDNFFGGGFTKRRTSAFTYFNTWSTTNYKQNLFYLVSQTTLTDPIPSAVVKSRTVFAYDVYSGNLKTYGTSPPAGTRDSTYDAGGYQYRGNLTSVTRYTNAAASTGPITKNSYFDIFGNVERADVNCCTQKTFTFQGLANGTGLYFSVPTSITDGPTGGLNLTRSATYDFANGNVLTSTNERGHVVTATHDSAWRTKTVTIPSSDNGTSRNVVRTMNYDIGSPGKDQLVRNEVLTYWDNGVQRTITNQAWTDGQGRVVRSGVSPSASGSFDAQRMTYDAIGRMTAQTNPYAGNSAGNPTGSTYSTTYVYDALSRAATVTLPDGDTISTTFAGKTTTVTDQVGRQRKAVVDGLGRTVTVYEQNPASGALDWTTANTYDVFDNVTDVKMYKTGGSGDYQQRTAIYDGLSRLIARTTPEVNDKTDATDGTPVVETFTYTDFDAVDIYTDGRGATINYGYDDLTRVKDILSTPAGSDPDTHDVVFTYETANAMKKGLLTKVTDYSDGTAFGEEYFYESNNLGRLQSRTRTIGLASQTGGRRAYPVSYTYNSIGQELTVTYPSNLVIKNERDSRGRLSAVLHNPTLAKFASGVTYNSAGLVEGLTINDNGSSVRLAEDYNYSPDRLQLTNQSVTKTSSSTVLMNFNYSYEADAGASGVGSTAGNSGQLMAVASGSTLNGLSAAQRFTYDTVGRLETSTGSTPGVTNKGTDTIGTFVAASSTFFLRNTNSPGAADVVFGFGASPSTSVPIRGDWDGDGADSIGLYDPATSTFYLKNTNAAGSADIVFSFGAGGVGYLPIAGDWNGDGIDTIGLYLPSTGGFLLRNSNGPGAADLTFSFGAGGPSMRAIGGDWNNDGIDTIGVCDTSNGNFFLKNSNTSGGADLTFAFGGGGATPLSGDWDGANGDSIGLYASSSSTFFLKNTNSNGAADLAFAYGAPGSLPVVGDWDGVTGPGGVPQSDSRRFVYHRFGNRTAMYNSTSTTSPASQTVSYQLLAGQPGGVPTNRINQVTTTGVGAVSYTHDRAGNVKNDGATVSRFDVFGRIYDSVTGATTTKFQYDSANRRIQKQVGTSAAVDYVWEGGQVLAEYDRASGIYTDYVWAGRRMIATVQGTTATFHHQDRLSTRLSTNASGSVIGTQSHFPFGEDAGTSGTVEKHRFTTYERDSESGTDYAMNRQHAVGSGRFIRPDPMTGNPASPQSLNRYSYTLSDPVNLTDPLGLNPDDVVQLYGWTFAFPDRVPWPEGGGDEGTGDGGGGGGGGSSQWTPEPLSFEQKICDLLIASILTGNGGLVGANNWDVDGKYRGKINENDISPHMYLGGHISGNATMTSDAPVYVPAGGTFLDSSVGSGQDDAFLFSYSSLGNASNVTLFIAHIRESPSVTSLKGGTRTARPLPGRTLLGMSGGKGGASIVGGGSRHSHFEVLVGTDWRFGATWPSQAARIPYKLSPFDVFCAGNPALKLEYWIISPH